MIGDQWEIIRVARNTAQSHLRLTITMNIKAAEGRIMSLIITGRTENIFLQMLLATSRIIIEEVVNESVLVIGPTVTRIAGDVGLFLDPRLSEIVQTVGQEMTNQIADLAMFAPTADLTTTAPKADTSTIAPTADKSMIALIADLLKNVPIVDPLTTGPLNISQKILSLSLQVGAMTVTKLRSKATLKQVTPEMSRFRLLYQDRLVQHCLVLLSLLLLPPPDQPFVPRLLRPRLEAHNTDGATKGRLTTRKRQRLCRPST